MRQLEPGMKYFDCLKQCFFICLLSLGLSGMSYAAPVVAVDIQGVKGDISQNVSAALSIEVKELGRHPSAQAVREFYKNSRKIIYDAITPYGYFSPRIRSHLSKKSGQWQASYSVELGQPVIIRNVNVSVLGEGQGNLKINRFILHFPISTGEIFTADEYNKTKDRFFEVANNQGFIKARFIESKVLVNTRTRAADVYLKMNTGHRYYFGRFTFNDAPYNKCFLQRTVPFHQKDHFSNVKLMDYQQDMNDSSYFSSALVMPDIEQAENDTVPVHVSIVPPKARSYNLGIGYGTFTGPRLTANVKFNRITDTGQSFDFKLKLSSVLKGMAAQYIISGKNPLKETWNINADYKNFRPKNGSSDSASIGLKYLLKQKHWQYSAALNYLVETYTINSSINNTPERTSHMLYPALTLAYLKTNDVLKPTSGKSLNVEIDGAAQPLLSSTSYLQGEIKGKYLITPLSFAQFIFRADLGTTLVHDLNKLPLTLRFFAGGPSSIRGFPDSSLGPGKYLAIGSIEYRNKIFENWWAAIFYDAGKVTNHWGTRLNRGAGIGVIYQSVVGPIKLYVARAESKPDKPYQIEFVMGPEF